MARSAGNIQIKREYLLAFFRGLFLLLAALGVAGACDAAPTPYTVSVDGVAYELSSVKTTYSGNEAMFQNMPWWGDATLAGGVLSAFIDKYPNTTVSGGFSDRYITGISSSTQVGVLFFISPGTKITTTANFTDEYDYVLGTALTSVPEIDGDNLAQLVLVLGTLWLLLGVARRGHGDTPAA